MRLGLFIMSLLALMVGVFIIFQFAERRCESTLERDRRAARDWS